MKHLLRISAAALLGLCLWSQAAVAQVAVSIANAGTTGTTLNALAKLTGAPSTAVIAATTDTGGIVGVVMSGAGTSGNALIVRSGIASCIFDGATTAGHYVQISSTTGGDCHDAGASLPTSGQIIGVVLSTNGSGGTYSMIVNGPEIQGGTGVTFANPTATIGNTAVNGSSTSAMRADAAPAWGPTSLPTPGTGATLVAPRSYYECTGTCTVTPPTPAAGYEFCIRNADNVTTVITLAAITSVFYEKTTFAGYGTVNTAATSGGAAGDKVCLLGKDATHYDVMSFNGTWSMP